MERERRSLFYDGCPKASLWIVGVIIFALITPFNIFSSNPKKPVSPTRNRNVPIHELPDSIALGNPKGHPIEVLEEEIETGGDSAVVVPLDSVPVFDRAELDSMYGYKVNGQLPANVRVFMPDPTRAVWMSALFPGLGQIYNRKYWKLPLVVAGFMGLAYGTSWNNMMLKDYTKAYGDIMDSDPTTNSYMDFFPSTTSEADLDKTWLKNILKTRKDFYRRNRDLCIISMVGMYLLCMVDAYVDASLANFDITPDLSVKLSPTFIPDARSSRFGLGLQWALNF